MQDKKIGNIITDGIDLYGAKYNVTDTLDGVDRSLPTIIIGLEKARSIIDGFNILVKDYPIQSLSWTYKITEDRCENEADLFRFYDRCYDEMLHSVRYFYVNFTQYPYSRLKGLYQYVVHGTDTRSCFLTRDSNFLFIYSHERNTVFGISLTMMDYIGVGKDKVKRLVRSNKSNVFVNAKVYSDPIMRKIIGNNTHYIPVLANLFSE